MSASDGSSPPDADRTARGTPEQHAYYAGRRSRGVDRDHPLNPEIWMAWWATNKAFREVIVAAGVDEPGAILDVGCGGGASLINIMPVVGTEHLSGIEIDPSGAARAQEAFPRADIRVGDAAAMPFADNAFDLTVSFTLFGPITDERTRRKIGAEMVRVTSVGGHIVVADWRYGDPRARGAFRGVGLGELATMLGGTERVAARKGPLAPPLGRPVSRYAPWAYMGLMHVPLLSAMTVSGWQKKQVE